MSDNILQKNERSKNASYGSQQITELTIGPRIIYRNWNDLLDIKFSVNDISGKIQLNEVDFPITTDNGEYKFRVNERLSSCKNMFDHISNGYTFISKISEINSIPDTSKCTHMRYMFHGCENATVINTNFQTDLCTNMRSMFGLCRKVQDLDLSGFNTENVSDMNCMFFRCVECSTIIVPFNTENVSDMRSMFYECKNITSLDLSSFDTHNVTSMKSMFSNCLNLVDLNISGFDFYELSWDNNEENPNSIFQSCCELTNVTGPLSNIYFQPYLKYSTKLTHNSAMVFINGLGTLSSGSKNITFANTTYNTLSEEDIAIATSKGWTVVSA